MHFVFSFVFVLSVCSSLFHSSILLFQSFICLILWPLFVIILSLCSQGESAAAAATPEEEAPTEEVPAGRAAITCNNVVFILI